MAEFKFKNKYCKEIYPLIRTGGHSRFVIAFEFQDQYSGISGTSLMQSWVHDMCLEHKTVFRFSLDIGIYKKQYTLLKVFKL